MTVSLCRHGRAFDIVRFLIEKVKISMKQKLTIGHLPVANRGHLNVVGI
jgi:hypothetical protein